MSHVLIFRHIAHEGPGYFAEYLDNRHIPWKLVRIDAGEAVPGTLNGAAALVFMGGPMSVNDPLPWIADEIRLIQDALNNDVAVLGHCLGGQLMARAMGGTVTRNRVSEIGWHEAELLDNPEARLWFSGIDGSLELFHWHGETFTIPPGAVPLLKSRYCDNQAFARGKHLALQCHVEMTEELVRKWANEGGDELAVSDSVQSAEAMQQDLRQRVQRLHRVADVLYDRWIKGLHAP
jgi:GMP synthase-like glutamine amidotransferase